MKTSKQRARALMGIIDAERQLALARDLLAQAKADAVEAEELQHIGVVAYGYRFDEGGWIRWYAFKAGAPFAPDVAAIHRAEMELAKDGGSAEAWGRALETVDAFLARLPLAYPGSGGPGQPFANHPHIRSTPKRLLVTQRGGLDI